MHRATTTPELQPEILDTAVAYLPPTMSMPLANAAAAFRAEDYRNTLLHLLDFFEMGVQWLNCYFIAYAARIEGSRESKGVTRAIRMIDTKRPLSFGDSVNEIFNPLLNSMQTLVPDHPLVKSLSTHVYTRKSNVLTGSEREIGVIKIRNDYKGHSTSLAQSIYHDVVTLIASKVEKMLAGLEPLRDASVSFVRADGTTAYIGGDRKKVKAETADVRTTEPGHYYVEFEGYERTDLFPLAIIAEDSYIYIFQTLKDEEVKYESSDENVHSLVTEEYNAQFDALLQRLCPNFDISKDANWNELQQSMRDFSANYMIRVQKEKKYSSELFVDRKQLSELLDRFSVSPGNLLPLAGDAGQGKTNQLCNWTEKFLEHGQPVLIFSCAAFADYNLADTLRSIFGMGPRKQIKKLLDHLHARANDAGQNIFFLFDALNECLQYNPSGRKDEVNPEVAPLLLFRDITELLLNGYPRFKVVTTCRTYTWKNEILPNIDLPDGVTFEGTGNDETTVTGFSDAETEEAYRKYGDLYQMATSFEHLDRRVTLRLRDPLVLKFVCSNYIGAELPVNTDEFASVKLFEKMVSDISDKSFAGHRQHALLLEMSRIILKSYLAGSPMASITNEALRDALTDAHNPLHRLANLVYKRDGVTVAYTELRNKPDRPILREVEKNVGGRKVMAVEFIYERFLEYMMAVAFLGPNHHRPQCLLGADQVVEALRMAPNNVVFIGAMRNAVIIDLVRHKNSYMMTQLVSHHLDDEGVMTLVNEVFDTLIRENQEYLLSLLLYSFLYETPENPNLIANFNKVRKQIASNRATSDTIALFNELSAELQPIIRMRSTAEIAVNNMLLSDYFNEDLYTDSVLNFLWKLVMDDIEDVGNETCKLVYYLSRRRVTHSHMPLRENLTKRIVREMYRDLKSRSLVSNVKDARSRRKAVSFAESATRLAVLLIIDAMVAPRQNRAMIEEMLTEIRGIARYFTWNFKFVKAVMPLLQTIMRRQITFQSVYVNNAIEYQGFWDDKIVPPTGTADTWSRPMLREAMKFVNYYNRNHKNRLSESCLAENQRFRDFIPVTLSAYRSGCSFSYFIFERLLIIVGSDNWETVSDVYRSLLSEENRTFEWFDYMQMSLIYSLFQIEVNSSQSTPEILEMLTCEVRDWTLRLRGLYKARHSHKANPTGLYKRNVVNWYCVAYCAHTGDNVAKPGDERPVPLLYELIDTAVAGNDKELLMHLLDNISEIVSDFGLIKTALASLKYILSKYVTADQLDAIDNAPCNRERFANERISIKIGSVLSTAKTYFPDATDAFIRSDLAGLKFPGIEIYREELLNYHPVGETLSDLFTHKFGNFLLWSLLHEEVVDNFAYEAVCTAIDSKDCFKWFDTVIRILIRDMFNVKV